MIMAFVDDGSEFYVQLNDILTTEIVNYIDNNYY